MGSTRNNAPPFLLAVLAAALAVAGGGCGKKAPPFLPVTLEARDLRLRNVLVKDGEVRITFRVPSEQFSFAAEEERWQRAELFRRAAGEDGYTSVASLSAEEGFDFGQSGIIVDDSPLPGRSYEYRVELRKKEAEERAEAGPVSVKVVAPPRLEEGLQLDGRESALALSWTAPPAAPDGTAYLLYRKAGEAAEWLPATPQPLSADSYVDTRVSADETYCYRVTVVVTGEDSVAEGPPSDPVCGSALDRTPPPPPTELIAMVEQGGIRLSWLPSSAADVKEYHIYRSSADGPFELLGTAPAGTPRFIDAGVRAGGVYRYRATAVDRSSQRNESAFSNTVSATFRGP